ncbi:MAG: hypothetical protein ABIH01_00610 [Candidatus Omnitrophota bacterium]
MKEGRHLTSELQLKYADRLRGRWNTMAELRVRKTDDNVIDRRNDLHIINMYTKLYNDTYELTGGDFYASFTKYTLNVPLEGFQAVANYDRAKLKGIFARRWKGYHQSKFARYVNGFYGQLLPLPDTYYISNFWIGGGYVYTWDDSSSIHNAQGLRDLDNKVLTTNLNAKLFKNLNLKAEFAHSFVEENLNDVPDYVSDKNYGRAFEVNTDARFDKLQVYYDYRYVQPDFYTSVGAAMPDRVEHAARFNYPMHPQVTFKGGIRQYHNHLSGSSQIKKTITRSPEIAMTVVPIKKLRSLRLDVGFRQLRNISDDDPCTRDDLQKTFDLKVSNKFWDLTGSFSFQERLIANKISASSNSRKDTFDTDWRMLLKILKMEFTPYFGYQLSFDKALSSLNKEIDTRENIDFGINSRLTKNLRCDISFKIADIDLAALNSDSTRKTFNTKLEYKIGGSANRILRSSLYIMHYDAEDSDNEYEEVKADTSLTIKF